MSAFMNDACADEYGLGGGDGAADGHRPTRAPAGGEGRLPGQHGSGLEERAAPGRCCTCNLNRSKNGGKCLNCPCRKKPGQACTSCVPMELNMCSNQLGSTEKVMRKKKLVGCLSICIHVCCS